MHLVAAFLAVFLTAIGQVLMKSGVSSRDSWLKSVCQKRTIAAFGMLFSATLFATYSLQALPLKLLLAFTAFSYVLVALMSRVLLKEVVSAERWVGCILISLGIALFAS